MSIKNYISLVEQYSQDSVKPTIVVESKSIKYKNIYEIFVNTADQTQVNPIVIEAENKYIAKQQAISQIKQRKNITVESVQIKKFQINENITTDSAIKNIVAINDTIGKVYRDLKSMAQNWFENYGNIKGFQRNAGGVGKRWYDSFYFNKMDRDLRTIYMQNPRKAAELAEFFNIEKDRRGHLSFKDIGQNLPQILAKVGKNLGREDLENFGKNWQAVYDNFQVFIADLEASSDSDEDEDLPVEPPRDNYIGRQNVAVEEIVNRVLNSLNKKVAGEIRNAIARDPNKLQALQRELARRNINLGESFFHY